MNETEVEAEEEEVYEFGEDLLFKHMEKARLEEEARLKKEAEDRAE